MLVGDRRCFWSRTTAINEFNTVEIIIINGAQKPWRIIKKVDGHAPGRCGYQLRSIGGSTGPRDELNDEFWFVNIVIVPKFVGNNRLIVLLLSSHFLKDQRHR